MVGRLGVGRPHGNGTSHVQQFAAQVAVILAGPPRRQNKLDHKRRREQQHDSDDGCPELLLGRGTDAVRRQTRIEEQKDGHRNREQQRPDPPRGLERRDHTLDDRSAATAVTFIGASVGGVAAVVLGRTVLGLPPVGQIALGIADTFGVQWALGARLVRREMVDRRSARRMIASAAALVGLVLIGVIVAAECPSEWPLVAFLLLVPLYLAAEWLVDFRLPG